MSDFLKKGRRFRREWPVFGTKASGKKVDLIFYKKNQACSISLEWKSWDRRKRGRRWKDPYIHGGGGGGACQKR